MRDIEAYAKQYSVPGFEQYKVFYRKKKIREIIDQYRPQTVLEIGCGTDPLFQYVTDVDFTVIEPSDRFFAYASELARGGDYANATCIHGLFEDVVDRLTDKYDMILCSALLHEVEDPDGLLKNIARICNEHTIVHINVPNANSMHRLLGEKMKIIEDVHDFSQTDRELQHNSVFDSNSLSNIVNRSGFEIIDKGSFFVKPFSHSQMYRMMEAGILDQKVLDGLYALCKEMPEFGSEVYVNCKLA